MISAPGIGSGLDVAGIVTQLMDLERRPLEALQARQEEYEAQLSAYGQVKSALSTFQDAMRNLNHEVDFKKFTATSSNEGILTANTNSASATGDYNLEVERVAQRHTMSTVSWLDTSEFGGYSGNSFQLTIADQSLEIDLGIGNQKTLAQLAAAINEHPDNMGVRATVINTEPNLGLQKLALVSPATGYENRIQLSGIVNEYTGSNTLDFGTTNQDADGNPISGTALSQLDAALTIDGIGVRRAENTVNDVIPGVTLNLNSAAPGTRVNLEVARDTASISESVKGIAEAYNGLMETLKELRLGDLEADSTIRTLENQIRGVLNQGGGSGTFSHLSQVGLSLDKYGEMQFDGDDLERALDEDIDSVAQLFAGDGIGIASGFDDLVSSLLGYKGLIQNRVDGIERHKESNLDDQYKMELRLETTEQRYYKQYAALDSLVAEMTNTSNYLTQQLSALNSSKK
jgi:flagellar hook-associated protein 2